MPGRLAEVVTYACWGITGLVWVAGALRARHGPAVNQRAGRDLASTAAVVVAAAIVVSPGAWWRPLTVATEWVPIAGLAVLLAATTWTITARVVLGSMWSSGVVSRQDHQLRTGGPYRVTRHPVYTGIAGMLVGTALLQGLGRWAALAVVVTLIPAGQGPSRGTAADGAVSWPVRGIPEASAYARSRPGHRAARPAGGKHE